MTRFVVPRNKNIVGNDKRNVVNLLHGVVYAYFENIAGIHGFQAMNSSYHDGLTVFVDDSDFNRDDFYELNISQLEV